MPIFSKRLRACSLASAAAGSILLIALPAAASPILAEVNEDFTSAPVTISYGDSSFTFSGTGDIFNPTALQTGGTGEVRSFGGFLGIAVVPSTDFYPARGSGVIVYDSGYSYAPFVAATVIPYSNGGNVLGLLATVNNQTHYGFAYTQDSELVSYGFESVANKGIDATAGIVSAAAVPEPGSWAMMIGGVGFVGGALRRKQTVSTKVSFA